MKRSQLAFLIAAAVLLGAQAPSAVKATTYTTYDVTLTAINGPEVGPVRLLSPIPHPAAAAF